MRLAFALCLRCFKSFLVLQNLSFFSRNGKTYQQNEKKCKKVGKSGKLYYIFVKIFKESKVLTFIGEHSSKIDAKGRVSLPMQLKRQINKPDEELRFVLKKSAFKQCLELHPMDSWNTMMERLTKKLNPILNKQHNAFLTQFSKGTSEVTIDGLNRILINKNLCQLADFEKEIVFLGVGQVIELWDKRKYTSAECEMSQEDFEALAGEIFDADFNLYE